MFSKNYEVHPAEFTIKKGLNNLIFTCQAKLVNGYAYRLTKTIKLHQNGFSLHYALENTGTKAIVTDEYVHNFMAIKKEAIGSKYLVTFPFNLKPTHFEETVNPEQKVIIGSQTIQFKDTPTAPFFFSNLTGNEVVSAKWELQHLQHKIAITENGDFPTDKINIWGWQHVISPELFCKINIAPSHTKKWTRHFEVKQI